LGNTWRLAIQGKWKVEKLEENGEDTLETFEGGKLKGATLTITADKIAVANVGELSYTLDPAAKPKAIDLDNGVGKTFAWVYTLDGDTLKICTPLIVGGERPKEVTSKKGSQTRLLVLKREAKDQR
jgi:uncharacterized protein (TIGR03067 family)